MSGRYSCGDSSGSEKPLFLGGQRHEVEEIRHIRPSISMEHNGNGAAKRSNLSSGSDDDVAGEDRLSALPDDVLVLILSGLCTPEAAQTSVLSRRWRRVWALLPALCFHVAPEPHRLRDFLAAGEVPLGDLTVKYDNADPESLSIWLPAAARRVSGELDLVNFAMDANGEEVAAARAEGAVELPCFEKATDISLRLGLLGLSVPRAGVFARLTSLYLDGVRFPGPYCELGDAVSSPRCPCLERLTISDARGLDSLAVDSKSLVRMKLSAIVGLRQLVVAAPSLMWLTVAQCFVHAYSSDQPPVARITAPRLRFLEWSDLYHQSFVQFGNIARLRRLGNLQFLVYGDDFVCNRTSLRLLQRFKVMECLMITLLYLPEIDGYQYLMDDMTLLPNFTFLYLVVIANGHAFGASSFHVLRMCTSVRRLMLKFSAYSNFKAPTTACSPGCICDQSPNWKTEELMLNRLQEIEIQELQGSEHEFAFVKRLFSWATALKQVTVTFSSMITESKIKELIQMFQSFSRPGICMKFKNLRKVSV